MSLDGRIVNSCLVLAGEADGAELVTIEGLAAMTLPTPLQRAFLEKGAAQCGYCTPGQVMAARDLLERIPHPTVGRSRRGCPATSADAAATTRSPRRCSRPPRLA